MPIKYIPIRAAEYRGLLRRLHRQDCSIEHLAWKFAKTTSWIEDQMFGPDTPERLAKDEESWMRRVRHCVLTNPDYTLEELALVLNEPVEKLKPYRESS